MRDSTALSLILDDDEDVRRVQRLAAAGARTGARLGAAGGPVGAGVGAGVGGAAGYLVGVGVTGVDPAERLATGETALGAGSENRDGDDGEGGDVCGPVVVPVDDETAADG